eukprot:GCRY01002731.1.p1 GENE.GCRY01002731.1~~GCRY01002731.1.p1  ORF type:complete len:486 (+),score=94.72 GCRY01002731.1:131-1588(+)
MLHAEAGGIGIQNWRFLRPEIFEVERPKKYRESKEYQALESNLRKASSNTSQISDNLLGVNALNAHQQSQINSLLNVSYDTSVSKAELSKIKRQDSDSEAESSGYIPPNNIVSSQNNAESSQAQTGTPVLLHNGTVSHQKPSIAIQSSSGTEVGLESHSSITIFSEKQQRNQKSQSIEEEKTKENSFADDQVEDVLQSVSSTLGMLESDRNEPKMLKSKEKDGIGLPKEKRRRRMSEISNVSSRRSSVQSISVEDTPMEREIRRVTAEFKQWMEELGDTGAGVSGQDHASAQDDVAAARRVPRTLVHPMLEVLQDVPKALRPSPPPGHHPSATATHTHPPPRTQRAIKAATRRGHPPAAGGVKFPPIALSNTYPKPSPPTSSRREPPSGRWYIPPEQWFLPSLSPPSSSSSAESSAHNSYAQPPRATFARRSSPALLQHPQQKPLPVHEDIDRLYSSKIYKDFIVSRQMRVPHFLKNVQSLNKPS